MTADYPPTGLFEGIQKLPEWIQLGCGDKEYICAEKGAMFPGTETPAAMPDFSKHNNFMSEAFSAQPEIYDKLKDKKTSLGVTLAKCIKTGVDNKGHPHIKTVGMVAGDEESYVTFKELFDPVVSARHGGYAADAKHPTNLNLAEVDSGKLDPDGKYVKTTRVRTGRSIKGTRLPPACTFAERRELEELIVKGLLNLEGNLKGDYFPLFGSRSYAAKPAGMTKEKEEELRGNGNLFQEPDSTLLLSSGCGRHWPDARGIFHNKEQNFFVWINEEDHMRIISMEPGDGIKKIFVRFATACNEVQKSLKNEGYDFMHSDHLGWILTCPSNLGTGLRAGAMIGLPLLSKRPDFKAIAVKMRLQVRGRRGVDSASEGGVFDISNADRIGKSEVQLVNTFIEGAAKMIQWEQLLEQGKSIDHLLPK